MTLTYLPVLKIQRDLYETPRGAQRFQNYLKAMLNEERSEIALPLVAMNPMAKDHLPPFLERLLEMKLDEMAAEATRQFAPEWDDLPGDFKVSLVVADDFKGGWTNRTLLEFNAKFRDYNCRKRGFVTSTLWTSQEVAPKEAISDLQTTLHRLAYTLRFGEATTLRQMMAQEGYAMSRAGLPPPDFDPEELRYIREILALHLDSTVEPILIPALFGDSAASQLGYSQLGLPENAGLNIACHDASLVAH